MLIFLVQIYGTSAIDKYLSYKLAYSTDSMVSSPDRHQLEVQEEI